MILKSYDTDNYTLNKTKSKDKPASSHMELAYVLKTDCDWKKVGTYILDISTKQQIAQLKFISYDILWLKYTIEWSVEVLCPKM